MDSSFGLELEYKKKVVAVFSHCLHLDVKRLFDKNLTFIPKKKKKLGEEYGRHMD